MILKKHVFLLFIIKLVIFKITATVIYACTSEQWDCDNGQCISDSGKCDGKVDCADGSDEIAENCIHEYESCPKYAYACSYGACVLGTDKCNGKQECADNSDELACSAQHETDLQKSCGFDEMQCLQSLECIKIDDICDGYNHCKDGSDESLEVCAKNDCPRNSFRCGNGACIIGAAKCNGIVECADGSDEAWGLCNTKRNPKKTSIVPPRPVFSIIPSFAKNGMGCQVPDNLSGMIIALHPSNKTIQPGANLDEFETIHLKCTNGAQLIGESSLTCLKSGEWNKNPFPSCPKFCDAKLIQGISTNYVCYLNDRQLPKCDSQIPPGTIILISCHPIYQRKIVFVHSKAVTQNITCNPDGTFSAARIPCEPDCGKVRSKTDLTLNGFRVENNEVPWHVALYEHVGNDQYVNICSGTIVYPNVVVTAAHCFTEQSNYRKIREPKFYVIKAGKYTGNYADQPEERPQRRQVEKISISSKYNGNLFTNEYDLAVLTLDKPLYFNNNISNACLEPIQGNGYHYIDTDTSGSISGYGQIKNKLDQKPVNMKTLERVFLTTLSLKDCRTKIDNLAGDKFCLENDYDSNLCRGDSGAGFMVKLGEYNDKKYYLKGVISFAPQAPNQCARGLVTVTNIGFMETNLVTEFQTALERGQQLL